MNERVLKETTEESNEAIKAPRRSNSDWYGDKDRRSHGSIG